MKSCVHGPARPCPRKLHFACTQQGSLHYFVLFGLILSDLVDVFTIPFCKCSALHGSLHNSKKPCPGYRSAQVLNLEPHRVASAFFFRTKQTRFWTIRCFWVFCYSKYKVQDLCELVMCGMNISPWLMLAPASF